MSSHLSQRCRCRAAATKAYSNLVCGWVGGATSRRPDLLFGSDSKGLPESLLGTRCGDRAKVERPV